MVYGDETNDAFGFSQSVSICAPSAVCERPEPACVKRNIKLLLAHMNENSHSHSSSREKKTYRRYRARNEQIRHDENTISFHSPPSSFLLAGRYFFFRCFFLPVFYCDFSFVFDVLSRFGKCILNVRTQNAHTHRSTRMFFASARFSFLSFANNASDTELVNTHNEQQRREKKYAIFLYNYNNTCYAVIYRRRIDVCV